MDLIKQQQSLGHELAGYDLTEQMEIIPLTNLISQIINSKVRNEIEFDKQINDNYIVNIQSRRATKFPQYVVDFLLETNGNMKDTLKQLVLLGNGVSFLQESHAFSKQVFRMMQLIVPIYQHDQAQVVCRAHQFFSICQKIWWIRLSAEAQISQVKIPDQDNLRNMEDGGYASVFEIIDQLSLAFKNDNFMMDRVLSTIKPDCISLDVNQNSPNFTQLTNPVKQDENELDSVDDKKSEKKQTFLTLDQKAKLKERQKELQKLEENGIEYSKLKIEWVIRKMDKTAEQAFYILDENKVRQLEPVEILDGLKKHFGVFLTREETRRLINHLDKDKNGTIEPNEFTQMITLRNMPQRCMPFIMSRSRFIDKMLGEWQNQRDRENRLLLDIYSKFDNSKKGKFDLNMFGKMLTEIDPKIQKNQILQLYKEALEIEACEEETDKITPDTLLNLVTEFKIGGFGKEFFTEYLIENLEQLSDRRVSCN